MTRKWKSHSADYFRWSWYRGATSVPYLLGQTISCQNKGTTSHSLRGLLELCLFQPLMFHKRILREIKVKALSGKSLITFILNQYHSNCQNSLGHSLEIDTPQAPALHPPISNQTLTREYMAHITDFPISVGCELVCRRLNTKPFLRSDS